MNNYINSSISSTYLSSYPTKVILVRHGRTTYNEQGRYQGSSDESVLTEKGYEAAYKTGLALQQYDFDAIYTSPLTRVKQTTQGIIAALAETKNNLPSVVVDPKLTEIGMSNWQGLFYQEAKDKFPEAYKCWKNTPHLFNFNNTSFPVLELFNQAHNFWQEVLNKHRGKTILVVAHSGTNRALISTAIGLHPEYYHSIQQSNCGISCLEFPSNLNQYAKLNYLNVTDHLGENLPKLKAGKTGWRWLLLSNKTSKNSLKSSCLRNCINQNIADLILTDNTHESELLTSNISKNSNKLFHLSMNQDHFLDSWQTAIFAKQESTVLCLEKEERPWRGCLAQGTRSDTGLAVALKDTPSDNRLPRSDNSQNKAGLVTGLIIASDHLLSRILHKTLNITTPLSTAKYLSVIHYPHANRQSILQGMLPIN